MKFSFQTILLVVFGAFILIGLAAFGGYINIGGSSAKDAAIKGNLVMWGTLKKGAVDNFLNSTGVNNDNIKILYFEKSVNTYENELINAFASGVGPDIFMVTPEIFWQQRDKMYEIPYASYPLLNYKSTYMDLANNYLTQTGIMAFPLFIDPLVGYWNKDIFSSAGFANAPVEWKEFPELSRKISSFTDDLTIKRSFVALGEFINIRNAKDILSLLLIQAGDSITYLGSDGKLALNLGNNNVTNSSAIALDFYTQFANPSNTNSYSWNKSFRSDYERFLSGDLAYYFGYSSEVASIRQTNPNLNFEMAFAPQADINGVKSTYGKLYGLAISKQSKNPGASYYAIGDMMASNKNAALIAGLKNYGQILAPVRRDLRPNDPSNPYAIILYESALVSRNWIDPNPSFTNSVWAGMINDVLSGKSTSPVAVSTARTKMSAFLKDSQ